MSHKKIGNILPKKIDNLQLARRVAETLKETHSDIASVVKNISNTTGIHSETVAKWCKAKNPPKSLHLLVLAEHYPAILKMIFELIGWPELWDAAIRQNIPQRMQNRIKDKNNKYRSWGDIFVTPENKSINEFSYKLNERQVWLLEELRKGQHLQNSHIVKMWQVTERTAKRDTNALVKAGVIKFKKTGRAGWYEIITSHLSEHE